jgi:N-methylhydantoinase A/oxoprolinase/acetone carboxylase beta subunit
MEFEVELEWTANFTSCLIRDIQGHTEEINLKTAPDGLTSLIKCVEAAAKEFGYASATGLLKKTSSVALRVPEIITDTLAKENEARIGLIVSQGHEANIYDASSDHNPVLAAILAQNLVVGVEEETNARGEQVIPLGVADAQEKVSALLNLGCTIIVVSLKHASVNPANEVRLKEIAYANYPRHYLGAVPILISSDFSAERDDAIRTNVCLLNAYAWFTLDQFLRQVENSLRQNGYTRSLKVVQTDGEAVPITRVTPLKTCGPDQLVSLNQFIGAAVAV